MSGKPELRRQRTAMWAVERKLINGGRNVLSANVFHLADRHLLQSSSASRFTASQAGFFDLSQSGERPER